MAKDFRVLAAIDRKTGAVLRPHEGERGMRYACPGCSEDVLWRKCDDVVRRSHFAHLPDATCGAGESVLHASAKLLVADDLRRWVAGIGPEPTLRVRCPGCGGAMPPVGIGEFCAIRGVHVERALESGLRPDVLVTDTAEIRTAKITGALEIVHTHPIDEEKAATLARDGVWWFELQAESVLEEQARGWKVLRASRRWASCIKCLKRREVDVTERESQSRARSERIDQRERESEAKLRARDSEREQELKHREHNVSRREASATTEEQRLKEAIAQAEEPLQRRAERIRQLDEDIDKRRDELQSVTAELRQARADLETVKSDPLLADRRNIIGDIDRMHATYTEIFNVAERARCRKLQLEREVWKLEARLWAQAAPGQE